MTAPAEQPTQDFTIEVKDRDGVTVFAGAVDVTRDDEYLTIDRISGRPARIRVRGLGPNGSVGGA